jgi:hypothetical protein
MCNYIPTLKEQVITIDLLGHGETECLGYVHSMEDNADAVHMPFYLNCIRKAILVGHSMGGYVFGFRRLYPEYVKAWFVEFNSQSRSEERKVNRDRAIRAVKQSFVNFISLSIANLFSEGNRERLVEEIENVKTKP